MFGLGRTIDPTTFKPVKNNNFPLFVFKDDRSDFGCFRGVLRLFKINTDAQANWKH